MDGDAPRPPRWVGVPRSAPLEPPTRATSAHVRVAALVARYALVADRGPVLANRGPHFGGSPDHWTAQ